MNRRLMLAVSSAALASAGWAGSGAGAAPSGAGGALHAAGADAMVPVMRLIGEAYMRDNPGAIVTVAERDSARGVRAVLQGTDEIGMTISKLVIDEGEAKSLRLQTIGRESEAAIVNRANPIDNLTRADIAGIYKGDIVNWKQLGGEDVKIKVLVNLPNSGSAESWQQMTIGGGKNLTPKVKVVDRDAIQDIVETDPAAIGHMTRVLVTRRVKMLSVDGVPPSDIARYPFGVDLTLVVRADGGEAVRHFIDFCRAPDKGQRIVAESGALPMVKS